MSKVVFTLMICMQKELGFIIIKFLIHVVKFSFLSVSFLFVCVSMCEFSRGSPNVQGI